MEALNYLRSHGFGAFVRSGHLHVWPSRKLTNELRSWIRNHREELIAEASSESERRNCWYVTTGEYSFPMIQPGGMTRTEALNAVRKKWPDADVQ